MESKSSSTGEPSQKFSLKGAGSQALLFLLIMTLGYTVYAADRTVLASMLKPMSGELSLTDFQKGLLSSAQYIGVAAVVFLSGHLSDRYGTRRIVILGVIVFTAFTWLIGFAADFNQAFLFRLVSGLGEGIFWPVAMSAVANYFGMRKGFALGIFYVGFDVGGAAGTSIGATIFALTADWRNAFFVAPLIGVAVVAGVFFAKETFSNADSKVGRIALGRDALELLKKRQVLVLMVFALLATWASVWQVVFLPYYYSTVLGLSVPAAGFAASAVLLAGGLGKVVLGRASDSWKRNRMLTALSLCVVTLYAVFFSTTDLVLSLASAIAMGFFSSAIFPVMQALMSDSSEGKTGTGLGLTTTSQSVATIFAPTITAMLFPLGVGKAIAIGAMLAAILMIVVTLMLKEPRKGSP